MLAYLAHSLFTPPTYHRQFDKDLPEEEQSVAKRVASTALPLLSLYQPIGRTLSYGMGAVRTVTHLSASFKAGREREWRRLSWQMLQVAWAVFALAATYFNFTVGLAVTSGVDVVTSMARGIAHLRKGEYEKALEEIAQALSSLLYLGMILYGSLWFMVALGLFQCALSLVGARKELAKGRYIEAIAKAALGMIRLAQARGAYGQIQRQNVLLQIEALRKLCERAGKGKDGWSVVNHPLVSDLEEQIGQKNVVLEDASKKKVDFGAHFHGYSKGAVKGANLSFHLTKAGEVELDFKINHVFRKRLEGLLEEMKRISPSDLQEVLKVSHSHATSIDFSSARFPLGTERTMGPAHQIRFNGLGTVLVGQSSDYPTLHGRVIIRLEKGRSLYDLHEILSLLNLQDAIQVSLAEDMMRLKMGHLYRIFFPKDATVLERSDEFFSLSLEDLRAEIVRRTPEMAEVLTIYLPRMQPREILPGRVRYAVDGLAEKAREMGAHSLVAAIGGQWLSPSELNQRVISMLKMGMLSSEVRFNNDIGVGGLSSTADFSTGGADSVFLQMIAKENVTQAIDRLSYQSWIRFKFSLKVLESGTYQYLHDEFGVRGNNRDYANRPGIFDFIRALAAGSIGEYPSNEVMAKERISPDFIEGILVENQQIRDALIASMREADLVQRNLDGTETFRQIPLERFIEVTPQAAQSG